MGFGVTPNIHNLGHPQEAHPTKYIKFVGQNPLWLPIAETINIFKLRHWGKAT